MLIDITLIDMKLWPIKEDGIVRPLSALPGVIANRISVQRVCKVAEI